MKTVAGVMMTALLVAALAASGAAAAVGVEKVSRLGGVPGDTVKLTLGCGFCYPPCVGPKGERHPKGFERGPCMLGTKEDPPASFGVFLAPRAKAPALIRPYSFLGSAVPPPGGNNPESGDPPRYVLRFEIPALRAGDYAYVIRCGVCGKEGKGSLISAPESRLWRLLIGE